MLRKSVKNGARRWPRKKRRWQLPTKGIIPQHASETWRAPIEFGLVEPMVRSALLRSLGQLRRFFANQMPMPILLDFSVTQKLHADGMLLFVAELRRLIKGTRNRHRLTCTISSNHKVCQVFEQIGLSDLLGIYTGATPADADVVNWRFAHGHNAEGEKYEDILAAYDGEIAEPMQEKLYTGITEAMTNVTNHAYDLPRLDGWLVPHEREWWMFSQHKDGVLSVSFCDLGAGIPRTLPVKRPNVWKRYLLLGKNRDSDAIEYSVKDSITRTNLGHRGKGLSQIFELIDGQAGAEVVIFSNAGLYWKDSVKNRKRDYRDSIMGTLIHWKIPLNPKEKS